MAAVAKKRTRADEISDACRALARVNRRRDGWEHGSPRTAVCAAIEDVDPDDVAEVRTVLIQLGIDPRSQYSASEIRALVLTDAIAGTEVTRG